MTRYFWHISDLHFRDRYEKNRERHAKLRELRSVVGRKDWLLITGDLTDNGRVREYEALERALEPFLPRVIACPGNHDQAAKGYIRSATSAANWRRFAERVLVCPSGMIRRVGYTEILPLNSNYGSTKYLEWSLGTVGKLELAEIENLSRSPHVTTIVMLHHHPFVNFMSREYDDGYLLKLTNSTNFLYNVEGYVDYVLFGHMHHGTQECHFSQYTARRYPKQTKYLFSKSFDIQTLDEISKIEITEPPKVKR